LYLETRATGDTAKTLKLGTVILAAADIDLDVNIQRNATERIGRAVERCVLYITNRDKALSFSSWLFGEVGRVGDLNPKIFSKEEIDALRQSQRLQIIDARVKKLGVLNHDYYHANPAVSSDFFLVVRYQLAPGAEHGRPLSVSEAGLWEIQDSYPGPTWELPKGAAFAPESNAGKNEATPSKPSTVTENGNK
jgi:esterase/lipase superfamily enzyme